MVEAGGFETPTVGFAVRRSACWATPPTFFSGGLDPDRGPSTKRSGSAPASRLSSCQTTTRLYQAFNKKWRMLRYPQNTKYLSNLHRMRHLGADLPNQKL